MFLDWAPADTDTEDVNIWEDNWDDDNMEDDFSKQLRLHNHCVIYDVPIYQ